MLVDIGTIYEPAKPWIQGQHTLASFVGLMIKNAFVLAGVVCFVLILSGGFSFITANGQKDKIESSWKKIQYAIMGFVIIFASYWIVQILALLTGSTDLKNMLGL